MLKRSVKWCLVLCTLVLLSANFCYAEEAQNTCVETTPADRNGEQWWKNRFDQNLAQLEQGDVELVMIGDSITHYWQDRFNENWKNFCGDKKVLNCGFSGDRTQHVIWRLNHMPLDKISPKLAVIMIGTNNVRDSEPENTLLGIQAIVDKVKTAWPDAKILLLEIFPRANKADDPLRLKNDKVNELLRGVYGDNKVANVTLQSLADDFLTDDGTLPPELMPDFLHPNAAGYDVWGAAITPFINETLGLNLCTEATPADKMNEGWWKDRFEGNVARMSQGNVDIVMLGDSITHGWDGAGKAQWDKFYGDKNAINCGFGGDRTQHVIWRMDNMPLDKISPKLVTLMIGTNNSRDCKPENTISGINAIVDRVKKAWPEAKLLLLEVFPRGANADDGLRKVNDKVNEGLRALYGDNKVANVTLFTFADRYLTEDGTLPTDIMPDLLHPNDAGYVIWGEAIEPFVNEALGINSCSAVIPTSRMEEQGWKERFEGNVARMEQGNVDLVMIGDSIIHGWDGAGAEVWQKYYGARNAINCGFGADRTEHVLWRLDNMPLDKISPKFVSIMIGTNNVGHRTSTPEETVLGIIAIVDRVKKAWPNTSIQLLEVFPRDSKPGDEMRVAVDKINEGLRPIYAEEKVENVELYSLADLFLDGEGILSKDIMPDLLHPSAAGYEIWAHAIEPMVAETCDAPVAEVTPTKRDSQGWMDRYKAKNEELKKGNIDILMIGDSITHGWEGAGYEQWNKFYGDKNAVNLGIGGDRTEQVLWRLENYDWSQVQPKLAVLLIGINNWGDSTSQNIAKGNRAIVKFLHKQFPAMKIIVLDVFPIGSPEEQAKRDKVNEINSELALWLRDLYYVQQVDINHLWLENGVVPASLMPDYVHPNGKGYELWGNEVAPYIQQAL